MIKEGTTKQVLVNGKFKKSLLVKTGYKLNEKWDLVLLKEGEKEALASLWGGLFWVGIWPFARVYARIMKFTKALPGGTYKERADPDTDFLLTGTAYQYALLFTDAEDKDKLPLSGQMTMTAMIINPYKALFLVHEWFDALVTRVLPRVRQYISEHTYDELINKKDVQLDVDVFKMLHEPNQKDPEGKPISIISILRNQYGIELLALEMVNIDPPPEYREATLRQFNAVQIAKAEAEETGGALDRMINRRIDQLAQRLGLDPNTNEVRNYLKKNPEVLRRFEEQQLNLLLRDRAGSSKGGLRDIRVANADGSNLEPVTATLFSLIEAWKGGGSESSQQQGGGDKKSSRGDSGRRKNRSGNLSNEEQEIDDELDDAERWLKQQEGKK